MKQYSKFQYFNLIGTFWHFLHERRWLMIVFYILTAIANIFMVFQPYVIGEFINVLQKNGPNLMHDMGIWLGVYVLLTLAFWLFHGPSRYIERVIAFHAKHNFYRHYYTRLANLPISWHAQHHSGNTINRINKAATGLWAFGDFQFVYVQSAIQLAGSMIMLTLINAYVALALAGFSAFLIFILILYDRVLIREIHHANEREHDFSSRLFDYVSNFSSVISFNLGPSTQGRLAKDYSAIFPHHHKSIIFNELKWFNTTFLLVVIEFIILFGYIYYHHNAGIPLMIGTLVAIYQYMKQLAEIFYGFAMYYQQLIRQNTDLIAVRSIDEHFEREGVKDEGKNDLKVSGGAIVFTDTAFHYNEKNIVFDRLTLAIPAHQKVGLVGHSGAGKTSLVNLLLRFYDVESGDITIDGQSIYSITHESQRHNIAVIPQDTSLFEDTLMENIRFGRLDATDEEVMEAARKANAHLFIENLAEGYNTYVGERGIRLSGGQRQRIAIARAILKNAPILVLDEATSALDSESEKLIQQSFVELMKDKTVIAIAHRLSTISHLDRLVVMDQGRIVEDGTHTELLAQGGVYASLWAMQSGGFLGE
jgi:ATP-binding cassette, subfamily B, bacterial